MKPHCGYSTDCPSKPGERNRRPSAVYHQQDKRHVPGRDQERRQGGSQVVAADDVELLNRTSEDRHKCCNDDGHDFFPVSLLSAYFLVVPGDDFFRERVYRIHNLDMAIPVRLPAQVEIAVLLSVFVLFAEPNM